MPPAPGNRASAPRCRTAGCRCSTANCSPRRWSSARHRRQLFPPSSATKLTGSSPAPPYSSGISTPMKPSSPALAIVALGNSPARVVLCGDRRDLALRELARRGLDQQLVFCEPEIHATPRMTVSHFTVPAASRPPMRRAIGAPGPPITPLVTRRRRRAPAGGRHTRCVGIADVKKPTRVNHPPEIALPPDNRALVSPIYQSVKFEFESVEETERSFRGERPGFFYSRASNPTVRQLELLVAELQGRDEALAVASGVAATSCAMLSLLKQGDHVLCFVETYGPTRYFIRRLLGRYGVSHTMISIEDLAGIERVLAATPTRLVVFESPTNPVTKIADLARITELARKHGALTMLDNTFAGLHNHGGFDIDLFVHSLTKYASGHGDVMGGCGDRQHPAGRAHAHRFHHRGRDPRPARGVPHPARAQDLFPALSRAVRERATHRRVPRRPPSGDARPLSGPGRASRPRAGAGDRCRSSAASSVSNCAAGRTRDGRFADALQLFALTASLGFTESLVDGAADAALARSHARAGADVPRITGRHRAPVDRSRGLRRPDRGSRAGAGEGARKMNDKSE